MPLRNSSSIYKEMALDTKTAPGMLTAISVPLRLVFGDCSNMVSFL